MSPVVPLLLGLFLADIGEPIDVRAVVLAEGRHRADLVALSPDGTLFTHAPVPGDLRVIDRRTRRVVHTLPVTGAAECAFSTDGRTLVVVRRHEASPAVAEVRDARTGRLVRTIRLAADEPAPRKEGFVPGVFVTDALLVVPRPREAKAQLFDVNDRLIRSTPPGSVAGVYDLRTGERQGELRADPRRHRFALAADGRFLAASDERGVVLAFDLRTLKVYHDRRVSSEQPTAVALSPDGARLAVADRRPFVGMFDVRGGKVTETQDIRRPESLAFVGPDALLVGTDGRPTGIAAGLHSWNVMVHRSGINVGGSWLLVTSGRDAALGAFDDFGPLRPSLASRDGSVVLAAGTKGVVAVEIPGEAFGRK